MKNFVKLKKLRTIVQKFCIYYKKFKIIAKLPQIMFNFAKLSGIGPLFYVTFI